MFKLSVVRTRNGKPAFWFLGAFLLYLVTSLVAAGGFLLGRMVIPVPILPGLIWCFSFLPGFVVVRQWRLELQNPADAPTECPPD